MSVKTGLYTPASLGSRRLVKWLLHTYTMKTVTLIRLEAPQFAHALYVRVP
jgi:hypothetical protein